MSLSEQKTDYDEFTRLNRGVNSGREPSLLDRDQVSFAINTTFRNGYASNRPGWRQVTLQGDSFQLDRWQGASAFVDENGHPTLVASINGSIFSFNPITGNVVNMTTTSGLSANPANEPRVWMTQAEKYLIIQDNTSVPLIIRNGLMRRAFNKAQGGTEVPSGNAMEYNNGRLWVARPDGKSFVAGDLAYSLTGTSDDVLSFTENTFLNGGGAFSLPTNMSNISALVSVAIQDNSTGEGPLQVFAEDGAASVNAPFDRTQWQNLNSPIQTTSLLTKGPTSDMAAVNVNGDIWYRAKDGIRSFMVARRDHGSWVNIPMSNEMDRILRRDDPNLLYAASGVLFDNRLLMTISPYRATETDGTEHGVAWRGLAVLDFENVSSMFERTNPSWEGIWTGLNILQILTVNQFGVDHCYVFALNSSNEIELWELTKDERFDSIDNGIEWVLETRRMGFSDQGATLKRLERTERWLDQIAGTVTLDVDFRPDDFWGWRDLDDGSVCATTGLATPASTPADFPQLQYRQRAVSSSPNTDCETATDKPYRNGYEFQFKLTLNGAAQIRRFRAVATQVPEQTSGGCLPTENCISEAGTEYDIFNYTTSS